MNSDIFSIGAMFTHLSNRGESREEKREKIDQNGSDRYSEGRIGTTDRRGEIARLTYKRTKPTI